MQSFTIFFGLAIVAIAIENFIAQVHLVKASVAAANGDQEFQSRANGNGNRYLLRGATGTEKVTIRDGNLTKIEELEKENKELFATSSKITIEFTNDACCEPNDKNVLLTSGGINYKISTNNNKFPTNYLEKWNCSTCSTSKSRKKDLQSRVAKADECYKTQGGDDCTKCEVVKSGLFCYPGIYTVEFQTENQCENVTFGGCDVPKKIHFGNARGKVQTAEMCNELCNRNTRCDWYRWVRQTQECQFMYEKYRSNHCNIRAGPTKLTATQCLRRDNDQKCDSIVDEECEYDGKDLDVLPDGDQSSADDCQAVCRIRGNSCQYWIYHKNEARCILKTEVKRKCKVSGGEAMDPNEYKNCLRKFHNEKK